MRVNFPEVHDASFCKLEETSDQPGLPLHRAPLRLMVKAPLSTPALPSSARERTGSASENGRLSWGSSEIPNFRGQDSGAD